MLVACSFWRFFDMPVYLRVLYTAVSLFFGLDFIEPAQRCVITKDSIAVESNPWYIQLGLAPPQRKVFPGPGASLRAFELCNRPSVVLLSLISPLQHPPPQLPVFMYTLSRYACFPTAVSSSWSWRMAARSASPPPAPSSRSSELPFHFMR